MLLPYYLRVGCVSIGKKVGICLESSERRVVFFCIYIPRSSMTAAAGSRAVVRMVLRFVCLACIAAPPSVA